MKKIFFPIILCCLHFLITAQEFERQIFDYSQMQEKEIAPCSESVNSGVNQVFQEIGRLRSQHSVLLAEELFNENDKCPLSYEAYSWALFRNGKWMESVEIIEQGIRELGPIPELILRRGYISFEMAELGIGVRNVDGNSVYLPKAKRLDYPDSIFREQNYLAALNDFKYISDTYKERPKEIMITGYIYQMIKEYENSNNYFSKLLDNDNYRNDVAFLIVDNYIGQNQFSKAEKILLELEEEFPRNSDIQEKLTKLYKKSGDEEKFELYKYKSEFNYWVPEYCDLEYSKKNYETIYYFLGENKTSDKIQKLNGIRKEHGEKATDIFITILNAHANHGNGVEERTEELLVEMGNSVVPKMILLMENAQSTCTTTKAASVLAEIKDPRGWQPMVDYLPRMENIPFTLMPPEIPLQLIKFDKEKALVAILKWTKGQLGEEDTSSSDNPFQELGSIFSGTNIYLPLQVYKKKEIQKTAKSLGYTKEQLERLLVNIFGKED